VDSAAASFLYYEKEQEASMAALFVALGIAVITLLALLLWFVPHLLHQQAQRSAAEAARLRNMLLDMLNEQEAVTLRQSQLGTSIAYLQDQLEQIVGLAQRGSQDEATSLQARGLAPVADQTAMRQLEERIAALQTQIQGWLDTRARVQRSAQAHDNEAWAHLMSLLSAIQERVGQLSVERTNASAGLQARVLLEELEQEMEHLRSISEDIATLQWRLRRSLNERESHLSVIRAGASGGAD
jgi:septation ring formation regulator EzrA